MRWLSPRPHGSALFTRGQTQVLSVTTLAASEEQILDGLGIENLNAIFTITISRPTA